MKNRFKDSGILRSSYLWSYWKIFIRVLYKRELESDISQWFIYVRIRSHGNYSRKNSNCGLTVVWILSVEHWIVEKCNSIFNGITGNMETNVEAVNLGHFEMLKPKEKTSLELFIGSKLLEVRIVFRCVMKIPHCKNIYVWFGVLFGSLFKLTSDWLIFGLFRNMLAIYFQKMMWKSKSNHKLKNDCYRRLFLKKHWQHLFSSGKACPNQGEIWNRILIWVQSFEKRHEMRRIMIAEFIHTRHYAIQMILIKSFLRCEKDWKTLWRRNHSQTEWQSRDSKPYVWLGNMTSIIGQ